MARLFLLFLILNFSIKRTIAFLNKAEKELTMALMENLEIRHWLLVEDTNITSKDLDQLKHFTSWNFPVLYLSLEQLPNYFLKEIFPDVNTLIVLKISDLKILSQFLNYSCHYCFQKFKWLLFLNNTSSLEHELQIPLYCLFLIAQQKNTKNYNLKEIYSVKEKLFSLNYGMWSHYSGLITSKNSIYVRRLNLNDTEVILDTGDEQCLSIRRCSHFEILKDFSKLMNFRLTWTKYPPNSMKTAYTGDIYHLSTGYNPDSDDFLNYDYLGPVFKVVINWYIKRPDLREQSDYFIRPFHSMLWTSILICLLVGSICGLILYYGNKCQSKPLQLTDLLFMTFDNFCNQDGFLKKDGVPLKISCFTFRFFALFMISAYSGVLISFLAIRQPQIPFQTLEEFVKDGSYIGGARKGVYVHEHFKATKNNLLRHVAQNYWLVLDPSKVGEKFCNEPLALLEPDNDIYRLKLSCPIYRLKEPIVYVFSVTVLRKHSVYTRIFNHAFLNYYSSGILKKLQIMVKADHKVEHDDKSVSDVTFNQIIKVLSLVPIGIVMATIIFLFEMTLSYCFSKTQSGKIQ